MTEGLPEYPIDTDGEYLIPVPLIARDHTFTGRPQVQQMESGRTRRRQTGEEMQEFLSVSWNFTQDEFAIFKTWFEETIEHGSLAFLLKTFEPSATTEDAMMEVWWEVAFVRNYTFTRTDNNFSVGANLEVIDKLFFDVLPDMVFEYYRDEGIDDPELRIESPCRENVSAKFVGLVPETVYALQIGPSADGPWTDFIYFALTEPEEIASGEKYVHMNNDFNGDYFRATLHRNAEGEPVGDPIYRAGLPLAPVIAPPDLELTNLSEITTDEQLAEVEAESPGDSTTGVRSLEYYSVDGYAIPYSRVEDPMMFPSPIYRRFKRKYGGRQWGFNAPGSLTAITSGTTNVVSVSGPFGVTIKWTRNGTNPTEDTPPPERYNGVDNNAYVWDHLFGGVLKARCFKDGCRSPLTMVAVDKMMLERPLIRTHGNSNDAASYCDLPDPTDGSESGVSCNLLYGGICGFEAFNYALGTSGGMGASSSPSELNGPLLQSRGKDVYESTYLGWPIHGAHSSYYQFIDSDWEDKSWFNGWRAAPATHNWAITNLTPPIIETAVDMTLCGPEPSADRANWEGMRDGDIMDRLPEVPEPVCNVDLSYALYLDRFHIMRSPLYWLEMRGLRWDVPSFEPPPDVEEPDSTPEPTTPRDEFTIYTDGNKVGDTTLDYKTTVYWFDNWTVRDATAISVVTGFDKFDAYPDEVMHEYVTPALRDVTYDPYDDGEQWEADEEWRVNDYFSVVYRETWDGIADGLLPFDTRTTGTGFETAVNQGWVYGSQFELGSELWDGYADGAFVPDDTGTFFVLGENWVEELMTYWFIRIMQQGITNPSGNNIGITEVEARETPGGTNYALAANGGTALASTEFSGTFAASKAIDGDSSGVNNGWANNGTGGNGVTNIRIGFSAPRFIKEYKVGHYPTGGPYPALSAWDLQYSYDGTIWMGTLENVTGLTVWTLGELKTRTLPVL